MKINKVFLTLPLFFLSVASFGTTQISSTTSSTSSSNLSQAQKGDAQILETLIILNTNEINAAKVASDKASNASIKEYAHMMIKDHSKNRQDVKDLATKIHITPMVSDNSKSLKDKGESELKKLKSVQKTDFDKTYIQAMVNDHQDALSTLNNNLIPNANNSDLKNLLTATRDTVSQHLQKAKDILSSL